jgi:hypothetical protein
MKCIGAVASSQRYRQLRLFYQDEGSADSVLRQHSYKPRDTTLLKSILQCSMNLLTHFK